jgi:hypothetical protein
MGRRTKAMARRKIRRAVKSRIRALVANELRQRVSEFPGHLEQEPVEVQHSWTDYVCEIADQISPEGR